METMANHAQLTVASRFESIELVQAVVDDLLREAEIDSEVRHWVGLAVREAVANAIKHGNRVDTSKRVRVDARVEPSEVVIRVSDQGPGFDPREVKDPLAPENLLRPGGRGIFYMRKLMDQVEFRFGEDGGTEVVLRKHVPREAANNQAKEEENTS